MAPQSTEDVSFFNFLRRKGKQLLTRKLLHQIFFGGGERQVRDKYSMFIAVRSLLPSRLLFWFSSPFLFSFLSTVRKNQSKLARYLNADNPPVHF